jgi:hypothetical protein
VSVTESYTLDADDGKLRPALGRAIFAVRLPLIFVFIAATAFFLWQASQLKPDASFEKMIPVSHPYIVNFLDSRDDLKGLGNSVRIIVETQARRYLQRRVPGNCCARSPTRCSTSTAWTARPCSPCGRRTCAGRK